MACYLLLFIFGIFCLIAYLLLVSFVTMVSQMLEPLKPAWDASMSLTWKSSQLLVGFLVEKTGTNQMWKLGLVFILAFSLVGLFWSLKL